MKVKYDVGSVETLLKALDFAAHKHQHQRRKGKKSLPYINHPIQVTKMLWEIGNIRDVDVLAAAILHDTLEDTSATPSEIISIAGEAVLAIVQEVTDDKSLPKSLRKQLQIEHAANVSVKAKLIKLADKICNIYDLSHEPPAGWSLNRIENYLDWTEAVVAKLRGTNQALEMEYDRILAEARTIVEDSNDNALS